MGLGGTTFSFESMHSKLGAPLDLHGAEYQPEDER